jgi:hypothetical protein
MEVEYPLCQSILQPTICSTFSGDNDCTMDGGSNIRFASRYYNRLSALLFLAIYYNRLSAVLYSVWRYYNRLSALLYLSILLPTSRSTKLPLCSVWRYCTPDYPMCSILPGAATSDYLIIRLSALICMAILQTTICCALLCLAVLQATIQSTDNRSGLYRDRTNNYLLCCSLSRETTNDYLRCSTAYLALLQLTTRSTCRYYNRLSALPIIRYVGVLPFLLGIWLSYFLQLYGLYIESIVWKLD